MRGLRVAILISTIAVGVRAPRAERALPDYRYFRALSLDLVGRPPTAAELAAFERPDFDLDGWLDAQLAGPGYAARLRRIYEDVLRLEVGPSFQYVPNAVVLRKQTILGEDGAPIDVYFRRGQRRVAVELDGDFCFTEAETGQRYPTNAAPIGTARPVPAALISERTRAVRPWWLYADDRALVPADRLAPDWATRFPGFQLAPTLALAADGKTPIAEVRVCREEAQVQDTGTVYASGRPPIAKGAPPPAGRLTQPPADSGFAKQHRGRAVSCLTATGFASSVECGCGIGLERCLPSPGFQHEAPAFVLPTHAPLGLAAPFEATPQPAAAWERLWWGEEAAHFLDKLFAEDRDVREMLTSRATVVNGPLAQFYRSLASASCCGQAENLGYAQPEPLVEPGAVPDALVPVDTATWLPIADRGPHAAGLLTMPVFLAKYGSRRARAHVVYNAFLCKDFVADQVALAPSTEPDLTRRPGCASCHQTLEPMAAYFTRVTESDWTWLPAERLPVASSACASADPAKMSGACKSYYDPAFTDGAHATLRGAYASAAHAEAGPAGLAADVARAPELAPCVVKTVAQALLGRPLVAEDAAWQAELARGFVDGGFRARALVKRIVTSPRYRDASDARRPR